MYRTGELEKDKWSKGGKDFEDFLNIEYKKRYAVAFSFRLAEYELPRMPEKYAKKHFYHRLSGIPQKRIGPKARVYRFPFKFMQKLKRPTLIRKRQQIAICQVQ